MEKPATATWSNLWTSLSDDNLKGFVNTFQEAENVRKAFEVEKSLTFVSGKKESLFGKHEDVLDHEIMKMNSGLYINHGLCEETPAKKSELKSRPEKHKRIHNRLKLVKTKKRKERSSKTKPAPDTCETVIIDGIVALDHHEELQEGIADMVSTMSASEWDALVQDAKSASTYQFAMDMVARTAFTMLEEIFPNGDHVDILHSLSHAHSLSELDTAQQLRLSLILLTTYVKKGKYHLQRDFAKEEAEASKAMMECIAAMSSLAETYSEPVSQGTKRKSEDCVLIEQPSAATKDEKKSNVKSVNRELKKKRTEKHVSWSDSYTNIVTDLTSTDIDQQKAQNHVDRIWDQHEESNYILAKVYGFNLTDVDIKSLKRGEWLTDQVMDGYLACLTQKEMDKGVKVKHEVVSTMTNIIDDKHVPNKKCRVMEYDYIIGAYHQRGGHWDIVIVEPKRGAVYFYNPLGETAFQQRRAINSWKNYVNRNMIFNTSWHLESKPHTKQLDSCNCGVYCLLFAERHLSGESLLGISLKDVEAKRREIGSTFLLYEVYMDKQCPCCGFQTSNEKKANLLQCRNCERYFHKKNHCVGMMALTKGRTFLCRLCERSVQTI